MSREILFFPDGIRNCFSITTAFFVTEEFVLCFSGKRMEIAATAAFYLDLTINQKAFEKQFIARRTPIFFVEHI
jgi:hypothetical protein